VGRVQHPERRPFEKTRNPVSLTDLGTEKKGVENRVEPRQVMERHPLIRVNGERSISGSAIGHEEEQDAKAEKQGGAKASTSRAKQRRTTS